MNNSQELDRLVVEKVMGWPFDRARTFSPSRNLLSFWEMEEYLMEDQTRAARYGEALVAEFFPEGTDGVPPGVLALTLAHASGERRCRAALRACEAGF